MHKTSSSEVLILQWGFIDLRESNQELAFRTSEFNFWYRNESVYRHDLTTEVVMFVFVFIENFL